MQLFIKSAGALCGRWWKKSSPLFCDDFQEYRELFQYSRDAIIVMRPSKRGDVVFAHINPVASRLLWYVATDARGLTISTLREMSRESPAHDFLNNLAYRVREVQLTKCPLQYRDHWCNSVEGQLMELDVQLFPKMREHEIGCILCLVRELGIHARYGREIERRIALEERLSGFIGSVPGFFYTFLRGTDGSNQMPYASDGMRELFGIAPNGNSGNFGILLDCIHPDDQVRLLNEIACSATALTSYCLELRVAHPDRGEIWVESRAAPIQHADGSIVWNGFMHDVTERKFGYLAQISKK